MKMFSKTILFIIITLIIKGTSETLDTSGIIYADIPPSQFKDEKIKQAFRKIKAVYKKFDPELITQLKAYKNQTGTDYLIFFTLRRQVDSYEVQYFSAAPKSRQNSRIVYIKKNGVDVPVPVDTSYIGGYRTVKPSEYSSAQFQIVASIVKTALPKFDTSLITKVKSASSSGTNYYIFFTEQDSTDKYEVQVYAPLAINRLVQGKPIKIIFIKKNGELIIGRG